MDKIVLTEEKYGSHAIAPSLNKTLRMHWAVKKKMKDTFRLLIRNIMSLQEIKKAKAGQKYRLDIVSYRKRSLDRDNLFGGHKTLIDALCEEGFVWDDDPHSIILTIEQKKATKASGKPVQTTIIRHPLGKII